MLSINFLHIINHEIFLQYALIAGLLASIGCGIIGSLVVVRKIEYIAGGIAHTVLAGMGIAFFLGKSPITGALITALIAAVVIGIINLKAKKHENTIISTLWAIGMAIGIIFINKTPGSNIDLMSYLFGNILIISPQSLLLLALLDGFIIVTVLLGYKPLLATVFDPEFAKLRGLPVNFYFIFLLCLVAITVVNLMQIVGIILLLALLVIPSAIARQFVNSVPKMMVIAVILGMFFTTIGLVISYYANISAGASIILLAGMVFFISLFLPCVFKSRLKCC